MKTFVKALAIVALCAAPAHADFFSPGGFNGWDGAAPMVETFGGSGIWEYSYTGATANAREQFVLLDTANDYSDGSKVYLAGDQWLHSDANGDNLITLDTNTYADGWEPTTNRVSVAYESETNWVATGNFQIAAGNGSDWDNASAVTAMTDQGGGLFKYEGALAPGTYDWKAVRSGSWDAIGSDSRNVNAGNVNFTTDAVNNYVELWVNVLDGTVRSVVTPEPATMALLGFGALALIRRRR